MCAELYIVVRAFSSVKLLVNRSSFVTYLVHFISNIWTGVSITVQIYSTINVGISH